MRDMGTIMLVAIEARALRRRGALAADLVEAAQDNKEAIWAEMDFDAWLADACQDCIHGQDRRHI